MPATINGSSELMDQFRLLQSDTEQFFTHKVNEIAKTTNEKLDSFSLQLREFRERGSRPPIALGAPETASLPLLATDGRFRDWLRGPRGKSSAYTVSFPNFRLEQKASPLLNTGGTVHMRGIAGPPQPALRLVELLTIVPMSSGAAAEYGRETAHVFNAGLVVEGAVKPTSSIDYANVVATVKTIATITKVSIQSLSDTPGLGDWLDARLRYAVQLKAEDWLLNAAAPDGLLASASTLDAAYTPAGTPTQLDVIAAAVSQLQAAGYTVDGVVLNGVDAAKMRLLKNTQEEYLWASPDSALGTASVWSVPLIISPSMAAGSWLVGAFPQSCLLFPRQMLTVEIAYENEDDFIRNLATLRAEERIASAVPVPQGLLKGTFTAPGLAAAESKPQVRK
jgi:hypothetical protein